MANERRARAAPLAALYESITGASPNDDSLQRMQRERDALGLNDNDALWSILAVLEYYLRLRRHSRSGRLQSAQVEKARHAHRREAHREIRRVVLQRRSDPSERMEWPLHMARRRDELAGPVPAEIRGRRRAVCPVGTKGHRFSGAA